MLLKQEFLIAAILYGIAAVSDILDGYIARKTNQTSEFGKIIDPVADKLIVISSLLYLGYKHILPLVGVVIFFAKEISMLLVGLCFLTRGIKIISSRIYGKIAMVLTSVSILMALLSIPLYNFVFILGLSFSIISALDYLSYYVRYLRENSMKL